MQFTASVHLKNLGLIPTSDSDAHCLKENLQQVAVIKATIKYAFKTL